MTKPLTVYSDVIFTAWITCQNEVPQWYLRLLDDTWIKASKQWQSLKQMFSKIEISKECFIFLQFTALKWDTSKVSENKYLEAFNLQLMSVLDEEL